MRSILILFFISSTVFAETKWIEFENRLHKPKAAAPLETQFSYSVFSDGYLNATVGGHYPIFSLKKDSIKNKAIDLKFQTGLFGFTMVSFNSVGSGAFDVDAIDTEFGLYLDLFINQFSISAQFFHNCANVSEGVYENPEKLKNISSLTWSREFTEILFDYRWEWLRPYLGFGTLSNLRQQDALGHNHLFQFTWGLEVDFPKLKFMQFYSAFDFNIRTEQNYFVNKSIVIGMKFFNKKSKYDNSFRIFASYYHGKDPRGNFYLQDQEYWGGGMGYFF